MNNLTLHYYSAACGVEVDDKFVITGGWDNGRALNSVVRYNPQGESEVLPSLTVARWGHACAGYLNGDGERVSWYLCE